MKKMQLLFSIVLLPIAFSFKQPQKKQFNALEAPPSVELVDIQPSDNRGGVYYMT
jgi:hypothetical protein